MTELQHHLINVYGGAERWQGATHVHAVVSTSGLAFRLKQRPFFNRVHVTVQLEQPFARVSQIGKRADVAAEFEGHTVRLVHADGRLLEQRTNARRFFPYGRRIWRWDDLDMAYFAGYAFWNYFSLPRLLMRSDIHWTQPQAHELHAEFPEHIPTHSRHQRFYVDRTTGLLRQHNYTVDVISSLATAAHSIVEHRNMNGLIVPSVRSVSPQRPNSMALGFPLLLGIVVHEFSLETVRGDSAVL